jgi:hypothetical protein
MAVTFIRYKFIAISLLKRCCAQRPFRFLNCFWCPPSLYPPSFVFRLFWTPTNTPQREHYSSHEHRTPNCSLLRPRHRFSPCTADSNSELRNVHCSGPATAFLPAPGFSTKNQKYPPPSLLSSCTVPPIHTAPSNSSLLSASYDVSAASNRGGIFHFPIPTSPLPSLKTGPAKLWVLNSPFSYTWPLSCGPSSLSLPQTGGKGR